MDQFLNTERFITLLQNSTRFSKKRQDQYSSNYYTIYRSRRNILSFVLWGHSHPDTQTTQRFNKERKLQTNIPHEHRFKNTYKIFTNEIHEHFKTSFIIGQLSILTKNKMEGKEGGKGKTKQQEITTQTKQKQRKITINNLNKLAKNYKEFSAPFGASGM